jgi:hypothetical protein
LVQLHGKGLAHLAKNPVKTDNVANQFVLMQFSRRVTTILDLFITVISTYLQRKADKNPSSPNIYP